MKSPSPLHLTTSRHCPPMFPTDNHHPSPSALPIMQRKRQANRHIPKNAQQTKERMETKITLEDTIILLKILGICGNKLECTMASFDSLEKSLKLTDDNYFAWHIKAKALLDQKECLEAVDPGFGGEEAFGGFNSAEKKKNSKV
ncbi:hypothetical protein M8J77_023940 [Diaphorina citri]|nr:hypothetical protein M8J77_023940 [Diaphorina citri]